MGDLKRSELCPRGYWMPPYLIIDFPLVFQSVTSKLTHGTLSDWIVKNNKVNLCKPCPFLTMFGNVCSYIWKSIIALVIFGSISFTNILKFDIFFTGYWIISSHYVVFFYSSKQLPTLNCFVHFFDRMSGFNNSKEWKSV